jgi:hypothetical protein
MSGFVPYGPMPIEIYASTTSVVAGSNIDFFASATPAATDQAILRIYRSSQIAFADSQLGTEAAYLYQSDYRPLISVKPGQTPCFQADFEARNFTIPDNVSMLGCGWPIVAKWDVPSNQPSSVYLAQVTHGTDVSYALFVVRPHTPGKATKVVCQISVSTHQAYNPWGGYCLYGEPISQGTLGDLPTISFARPCQLWDYILYDEPIVTWLEANSDVEFMTNVDLDASAEMLSSYQLFISCGHDEYWSGNMRDNVEAFALHGGNVLFLSGNTAFRPVSFSGQQMVRLDESWRALGRPEAWTTGVMWSSGRWNSPLPQRGYVVQMANHWVFDGTGLQNGDQLGGSAYIMGYETDAGVYDGNGNPISPSPSNLVTIANADLWDWTDQPGNADMAAYWKQPLNSTKNYGYMLTVGSTAWGQGLRGTGDPGVVRVMTNMITRMQCRFGIIYAVHGGGNLEWYRDFNQNGTGDIGSAATIGTGGWLDFRFLTADETGVIYAVTTTGDLLWYRDYNRDGTGNVTNPKRIGTGAWDQFQFFFSGGEGIIYTVSTNGNLSWNRDYNRDGTGTVEPGPVIGHGGWSEFQSVFSGGGGIIYAIDKGGDLYFYRDRNRDGTGNVGQGSIIGIGGWNKFARVFGDSTGNIYAVTPSGNLLAYKDYTRNGTGHVSNGTPIGMGGWNSVQNVFSGS